MDEKNMCKTMILVESNTGPNLTAASALELELKPMLMVVVVMLHVHLPSKAVGNVWKRRKFCYAIEPPNSIVHQQIYQHPT
jgi:hypothetical protein